MPSGEIFFPRADGPIKTATAYGIRSVVVVVVVVVVVSKVSLRSSGCLSLGRDN